MKEFNTNDIIHIRPNRIGKIINIKSSEHLEIKILLQDNTQFLQDSIRNYNCTVHMSRIFSKINIEEDIVLKYQNMISFIKHYPELFL